MNDRYAKAMEYVRACRRWHDEHLLESRKVRRRLAMYPIQGCRIYSGGLK